MTTRDPGLQILNTYLRGRFSRRQAVIGSAVAGTSLALGSTLAIGSAIAAQAAEPTGEIVWGLDTVVPNIIPFGGIALAQWQGKEFMYDSLLAWDADLNVIPALAESWETPDDTTYVFNLRPGVKFHNDQDLTAADVVYSLNMALNPVEPGVKVPYLDNIATVEAIDDLTVQVTMTKADPTLTGTLAWTHYTPIVPDGIFDEIEVLSEGIGTGPFRLSEYIQDDQIVYEAFPDFWGEGPGVQKLTLKMLTDEQQRVAALRSGEIDGANFSADVAGTLASDEITVISGLTSSPYVVQLNLTDPASPWADVRVRQAMSKAIDRQDIIDKVFAGYAQLTAAIPPGYGIWPLANEELVDLYAVDVAGATALMAEAGFADGFDVTLQTIAGSPHVRVSEIIQQALEQLNINVSVEPIEIGTFAENVGTGNFQWAQTARGMRGDPSAHVVDFRSGTSNNLNWFGDGWISEDLDALFDEGLATLDEDRRLEIYLEIQRIIATEVPNLYTVQPEKFQAVNNRLQDMYVFYGNTNPGLRTATVAE